jgi:hypothetical protein
VRAPVVPARSRSRRRGDWLRTGAIAAALLAVLVGSAAAQGAKPFTVEARGGLAYPMETFDQGAKVGFLAGATAKYSPLPFISVYGGWDFARFGAEDDAGFAGVDTWVKDSGLRVGGELGVPLAGLMSGIAPYFQAGVTFTRARVDVSGGEAGTLEFESDVTRGFEVGGGARIWVAPSFSITPEIRYRRTRPDFEEAPPLEIANEVAYLVTSLGFNLHF